MSLFDRVRNICLTPATEWPVIAEEPSTTGGLLTGFVAPLAAASAIAGFIGASIIGQNSFIAGYVRIPIMLGLWGSVFSFVMTFVGILVCAFIINALAPTFGGQKDGMRALKVAVYSFTPALVVGLLKVVPPIGVIAGLLALYSLYLLYLGLPVLMKSPPDKALGYTVVTCITVDCGQRGLVLDRGIDRHWRPDRDRHPRVQPRPVGRHGVFQFRERWKRGG